MAVPGFERKLYEDEPVAKKNSGGLSSLLPTGGGIGGALAGGAGGAAIGSVVPGVGTAIGGLIGAILGGAGGSALGKVGQNAVEGEKDLGKDVLGEAILGGITSTPITGGIKLLKAGGQATKGILAGTGTAAAKKSVMEAGQLATPKMAKGLQSNISEELSQMGANDIPTGKIAQMAQTADAKASGLGVGKSLSGKTITPKRSQELYEFARTKGVTSGTPMQQARQAEELLASTTRQLDDSLESINRSLDKTELSALNKAALSKVASDASVTGTSKTLGKFAEKIKGAKDIKALEAIRREADDIAYTARGAGKTSAAAQARAVRETIDDFVSGLSKDYKTIKGDYVKAKDLLELSSKNAGTGGGIDVFGNKIGSQIVPGAISKTTGVLGGVKKTPQFVDTTTNTLAEGAKGAGILGTAVRQSLLGNRPGLNETPQDLPVEDTGLPEGYTTAFGLEQPESNLGESQSPFDVANVESTVQSLLAQGADMKEISAYLANVKTINDLKGGSSSSKPLSAEASKVVGNANSGLQSLAQLENIISSQGGEVSKATLVPGRELFGNLGANVLGTAEFDNASKNLADVVTRLRTGAALTDSEEAFYKSQLPQAFDSPDVIAQKLEIFKNLFNSVASRTGTAGTDMQALTGVTQ